MSTPPIGRRIHVVSTKYDGSPHWDFDSFFVLEEGPLVVTLNFAGQELMTWNGPWTTPFDTRNHFWCDRWYNVMRCDLPRGGGLDSWYCNVTTPAQYDGETVRYVDLDLDVHVFADGRIEVLDEDEFLENSRRMGYPPDVIEQARSALDDLLKLARSGRVPFERAGPEPKPS
jgi:protein associated with RNAse G/E